MVARFAAAILILINFSCTSTERVIRGRTPVGTLAPPVVIVAEPAKPDSSVIAPEDTIPSVSFKVSLSDQSGDKTLQAGEGGILWVEVMNISTRDLQDVAVRVATKDTVQKVTYEDRFEIGELPIKVKGYATFILLAERDAPAQTIHFDISVRRATGRELAPPQQFTLTTK